jgi:hypothetical protein
MDEYWNSEGWIFILFFIFYFYFHFVKLKNSFLPVICDHMGCIKLGKKLFYYFLLSTD